MTVQRKPKIKHLACTQNVMCKRLWTFKQSW